MRLRRKRKARRATADPFTKVSLNLDPCFDLIVGQLYLSFKRIAAQTSKSKPNLCHRKVSAVIEGCVTFALGAFAPPYFGTFAPPILGHLLSLIPDICSSDICSQTFAPPYFGTFALRHQG